MKIGFGIYYIAKNENDQNEIKMINFDIITSDLKQTGQAAVRGFRFLRKQKFFEKIEKKNYIVWSDCGKHFRNQTFCGYLFNELAKQKIHGKNLSNPLWLIKCGWHLYITMAFCLFFDFFNSLLYFK